MIETKKKAALPRGMHKALICLAALGVGYAPLAHADVGPGPRVRPQADGPTVSPQASKPQPLKPGPAPTPKPGPKVQDQKQREEVRSKLLARVREVRAKALTDLLKPDAAATAKVVEIAAGFEDRTLQARQEMRQHRQQLEELIKQPRPDDAAINQAIEAVTLQRLRLRQAEDERSAALRKVLTPAQYAKVMIAWPRINRRIQEQLFKALLQSKGGAAAVDED